MSICRFAATAALAGCALVTFAVPCAVGDTFGFPESCTNNVAGDVVIGAAQLSVDVSNPGAGFVDFTFMNSGPLPCSITDLYWDDNGGELLGLVSIVSGPGTSFSQGASPGNLPGGNNCSPPFEASAGFTADSNPPAQPNGVNPGEFVTVRFSLVNGGTFADVINQLNDETIRIGIHVQGFASGNSEAFVIPSPGATALGVLGLGVAGRRRRR